MSCEVCRGPLEGNFDKFLGFGHGVCPHGHYEWGGMGSYAVSITIEGQQFILAGMDVLSDVEDYERYEQALLIAKRNWQNESRN